MPKARTKYGFQLYRLRANPEERRFSTAWHRQQAGKTLAHLLSNDNKPSDMVSARDNDVAATVIQWLGSPVGQAFLRDLGYERERVRIALDPRVKLRNKKKERGKNIRRKVHVLLSKINVELVNLEVLDNDGGEL
jgi:hypothetical protein